MPPPGAPACDTCYKISVSKAGYSSDRTYAPGETIRGTILAIPAKNFISVVEAQQTDTSFSIDRLSTQTVQSIKYAEEKTWSDSFDDLTKIGETFQTVASTTDGTVKLDQSDGQYFQTGYLVSDAITPSGLTQWGRLNWNQDIPASTNIKYHLLYSTSSTWDLIPDENLTVDGVTNSAGFDTSPVDISDLDINKYKSVKIKADFNSDDASVSPTLFDWQITWFSSNTSTPIPNLAFTLQGLKTLGTDVNGNQIYKYQQNLATDGSGQIIIGNLEWDSYKITVNGASTGYDIANSLPAQPFNISPDTNQTTTLKLANHQANTVLVIVRDSASAPLTGASVRLYKTGYDKLKITTDSGQTFFSPLAAVTYTLEVTMTGFQDYSEDIVVSTAVAVPNVIVPVPLVLLHWCVLKPEPASDVVASWDAMAFTSLSVPASTLGNV